MNKKLFINFVRAHCKLYDVRLRLPNSQFIYDPSDNSTYSGYFDDINKKIVVAFKNKNLFGVLAHEYCHFTQWVDKCPEWIKADVEKSYYVFNDFLNGEKVENPNYHIDNLKNVELDNEKRTVNLIEKLKLPIDRTTYIKKANAYIYFYNWIKETGRWSKPNNSPYTNDNLWKAMPENFHQDYSKIPPHLYKIFKRENI